MQRAGESSERTPLVQPTYLFESSLSRRYQKRLHNFQCAICISLLIILAVALLVTVGYNLSEDLDGEDTVPSSAPDIPQTVIPVPVLIDPSKSTTSTTAPLGPVGNLNLSAGPRLKSSAHPFPPTGLNLAETAPDLDPLLSLTWPLKVFGIEYDCLFIETISKSPNMIPLMLVGEELGIMLHCSIRSRLPGRNSPSWNNTPTPEAITKAVQKGNEALMKKTAVESKRRPLQSNTPASRAQRAAATGASVKPLADNAYAAEMATRVLINGSVPLNKEDGMGVGPPTSGLFPEPPYCLVTPLPPCKPSKYRSTDGSCNNLEHPQLWGVSHTPFRRALPADYGDGVSSPRQGVDGAPLPSARDVSVTVHRPSYAHDSQFTVMLAVWGQFVDHDVTATALSKGENSSSLSCCDTSLPPHPECFPVSLDVGDPFYEEYNLTCMEFVRSAPAPTCHFGPRQQMNQATAYIDGSTVYGFSENRTKSLRSFSGGLLETLWVGSRELLPISRDPDDGCNTAEMNAKGRYCFVSGDDRANENLHLTTMHLIWARQHNRIATALGKLNPAWDDETVFQEARRIVGAQMQHITYTELLPNILGADVMWALNLTAKDSGYSSNYDPTVDPSIANHFSASAFRFAHTLLPGLIHSANQANGTITYMQLHHMLFNPYALYQDKGSSISMRSAMETHLHTADLHVTDELSNHLFERPVAVNSSSKRPGPCGLDLVSLNIQRGRDHGLPPYTAWRGHCGLYRPKNFTDLAMIFDDQSNARIRTIYKNVDDIDLYTGALAENPKGRLLGPTLTCLIADQFLRLNIGDRFWYETDDTQVGFTIEQLTEIRKTSLAGVICANEELLDQAQPRVMEAVSATNPLVDCRELPQPQWTAWKEDSSDKEKKKNKKN